MNVWKAYQGKKVFILTIRNRTYSGIIETILQDGDQSYLITIIINNEFHVTIPSKEIAEIKEER